MPRWLVSILVAPLLFPSFVIAEEIKEHPDLDVLDDDSALMDEFALLQEEEIVLSAAKHKQKIGFSPAAVIVITRREIEESGATTVMELLRRYSAIHVYDFDPLFPNAEIRGGKRLLMILDGRDVNLEIFEAPFFAALPVGIHDIDRIEVVLGPNSALYGANAVAAVINVITRQPEPGFHADLSLASGEHGTTIFSGLIEGGTGIWAAQATFGIDRADSWMDRRLLARNMQYANGTLRLNIQDGSLTVKGGLLAGSGRIFGAIGYLTFHEFLLPAVQAALKLGKFKVLAYWYAIRSKMDMELDLLHAGSGLLLATLPIYELSGDTFHIEGQYDLELFEDNLLITGADARFSSYRCDNFVDTNIFEARVGVFLHDEHRFSENFLLTVGARFDWNSKTEPAISPRIALVYNPGGEHFLRLSGGYAFRKPTLLETSINIKIHAEPAFPEIKTLIEGQGLSNPDMENEILTAVDIGYRGSLLDKALRLGADAYFGLNRNMTSFINDIRYVEFGRIDIENSRMGYNNEGKDTNIFGINLSIEGEPYKELTLFLRGEYRHEWYTVDNSLAPSTPRFLGAAGGTLRCPFGLTLHMTMVTVAFRSYWVRNPVSALAPSIDVDMPAHTYLLAALTYHLPLEPARLDLGLTFFNAFGARIREAQGTAAPDGSNYGGELLGSRAMLTARILY